jgi:ElaB/YqjD/DUF883 family membrane-anchored ribosome-binding protein
MVLSGPDPPVVPMTHAGPGRQRESSLKRMFLEDRGLFAMKRQWRSNDILIPLVALVICVAFGCRSTRQTMSSWPGLGWMAPRESGMDFEEIAHDGSVEELATPSEQSSPVTPYSVAQDAAQSANTTPDYPDTGYPSTYGNDRGPGRYGESTRSTAASGQRSGKRGFYNERYNEYAGTDDPGSRSEAATGDRYGQPSAKDVAGGTDESYRDTINRYRNSINRSVGSTRDELNGYVERTRSGAANPRSDLREDLDGTLSDGAQNIADDIRDTAAAGYNQLKDQAGEPLDRVRGAIGQKGANLADQTNETTRYASDQVERGVNSLRDRMNQVDDAVADGVSDAVSGVTNRFQQTQEPEYNSVPPNSGEYDTPHDSSHQSFGDPGSDREHSNVGDDREPPATELGPASGNYGQPRTQPYGHPSTQPTTQPARQPAQPWRPGSTSSYPLGSYTEEPTAPGIEYDTAVRPTAYRQPDRRSDAGWRRNAEASTIRSLRKPSGTPVRD